MDEFTGFVSVEGEDSEEGPKSGRTDLDRTPGIAVSSPLVMPAGFGMNEAPAAGVLQSEVRSSSRLSFP